jgi:hypothetical protein
MVMLFWTILSYIISLWYIYIYILIDTCILCINCIFQWAIHHLFLSVRRILQWLSSAWGLPWPNAACAACADLGWCSYWGVYHQPMASYFRENKMQ